MNDEEKTAEAPAQEPSDDQAPLAPLAPVEPAPAEVGLAEPEPARLGKYKHVIVPGFEQRPTFSPEGKPGRPSWAPITNKGAWDAIQGHHDHDGARLALDKLDELRCGSVVIRRCRKRTRNTAADRAAAAE